MLQINVSQLLKSPIGATRKYDVDGTLQIDDHETSAKGEVKLMRTDQNILVTGKINTERDLNCGRCLTPFKATAAVRIEEEYFPTRDISSGTALPGPDEPGVFTIDENGILDLTEAVRQYTVLLSPMKPLCRQDCAGLCPVCGTNLNQSECDCPRQPVDPRWAKLSELALTQIEASAPEQKGTE